MSDHATATTSTGWSLDRLGPPRAWVPQLVVWLLVAAAIVVAVVVTPNLLTVANIKAILRNASIVGIVAVAMTPMTLSGNFVSLAAQQSAMAAAIAFIALVQHGWAQPLAIVVTIAVLIVIGALQGLIVAAGLNPVITTLAAGAVIYGVVADWTGGMVVSVGTHPISWGDLEIVGVPIEVIVFALVTIGATVLMAKTVIGRQSVLTGANRATAELSGIRFSRVTMFAFAAFSVGAAIAGILYGAAFGEGNITSFGTLTVDVVAAVLVGGTAIQGGHGSPLRSAGGALLIALISNIMLLNDFTTGGRLLVQGAVVVGVVMLLQIMRRLRAAR
jgi:ribose transport system permease protein